MALNGNSFSLDKDLRDKPLSTAELRETLAHATYSVTQRALPRGRTPIKSGAQLSKYVEPLLNPIVDNGLETLISGVFYPDAAVQPVNDYETNPEFEALDTVIVDRINKMLANLDNDSWHNILKTLVWAGMGFGVTIAEMEWESQDGFWNLNAVKGKPSFDFDINVDEFDNIQSLHHLPTGHTLNPNKFVIGIYPWYRDGNPYGVSELEPILHDIRALEEIEEAYTIGAVRTLNRPVLHYFDQLGMDEDRQREVTKAVDTLINGHGTGHFPAILNEETNTVTESNIIKPLDNLASGDALRHVQEAKLELIKRVNRNFGIMDNLGQSTVPVGSLAKSKVELNMFNAKVANTQQWISAVVNRQIIQRIVDYNFSQLPDGYRAPIWSYEEIEDDIFETRVDSVIKAVQAGIMTREEGREKLNLPAIDVEEDIPLPATDSPGSVPQPGETSKQETGNHKRLQQFELPKKLRSTYNNFKQSFNNFIGSLQRYATA